MFEYKTLEDIRIEVLQEAFVDAFSDYQVKFDLPLWKFQRMLQRRGFTPGISVGAFKEGRLVGFVLNGLRDWEGKLTSYDLGTGVIGEYRRQGITSNILSNLRELLREKGIEQYLLEVIKTNTSAYQLYLKQGFEVVREFACYQLDKKAYQPRITYEVESAAQISAIEWERLQSFWDYSPSWQNSVDSINALAEVFHYSIVRQDGVIVGYGIMDKSSGDIAQLAVDQRYRHRGIAGSILSDLMLHTESERASILNVDERDEGMKSFLKSVGFVDALGQYEMLLNIQ